MGPDLWRTMEHQGPTFPPSYSPLPPTTRFYYDGVELRLNPLAEEAATLWARVDQAGTNTKVNFLSSWRGVMNPEERHLIKDLALCDFSEIDLLMSQRAMGNTHREEVVCRVNGQVQRVVNSRIEGPSIFLGRGPHPLSGRLKGRILPEDVTINCTKDKVPEPPEGHRWGGVQHNHKVSWLACWRDPMGRLCYMTLHPTSSLAAAKERTKFNKARNLGRNLAMIRRKYEADLQDKEMRVRQRAVALYFIDRLALRTGNKKGRCEADTVGCCSLRVEHLQLATEDGEPVVKFDFPGKDSIRYTNTVVVDPRVHRNLRFFIQGKQKADPVFDCLSTSTLNRYLASLMDGLSARVFRTHGACWTMARHLREGTDQDDGEEGKLQAYQQANREVALLCNHQDKEGTPNLDTSRQNYLDPRITLEWSREFRVPLDKVLSVGDMERFKWALD